MREEWKPIQGFIGLYEISNFGNVRNNWKQPIRKEMSSKGFEVVKLKKDGMISTIPVKMLVWQNYYIDLDNLLGIEHNITTTMKPKSLF